MGVSFSLCFFSQDEASSLGDTEGTELPLVTDRTTLTEMTPLQSDMTSSSSYGSVATVPSSFSSLPEPLTEPDLSCRCVRYDNGWWSCGTDENACFFNPCAFLLATYCLGATTCCCAGCGWLMASVMSQSLFATNTAVTCTNFGSFFVKSATNNPLMNKIMFGGGGLMGFLLASQCCWPNRDGPTYTCSPCYCGPRLHH